MSLVSCWSVAAVDQRGVSISRLFGSLISSVPRLVHQHYM